MGCAGRTRQTENKTREVIRYHSLLPLIVMGKNSLVVLRCLYLYGNRIDLDLLSGC